MSKYYKKPHRKSFRPVSGRMSYPNHKYSYDLPKPCRKRLRKKFLAYEYRNEDLFELLWGEVAYAKSRYRVHSDWHSRADIPETERGYYPEDPAEFDEFMTELITVFRPRWRQYMSSRLAEERDKKWD